MNMRISAFPEDAIVEEPEEIVMSTSRFSVDSVMQSSANSGRRGHPRVDVGIPVAGLGRRQ
jgi:hypothetical protein